jgi:hypothetical protein
MATRKPKPTEASPAATEAGPAPFTEVRDPEGHWRPLGDQRLVDLAALGWTHARGPGGDTVNLAKLYPQD